MSPIDVICTAAVFTRPIVLVCSVIPLTSQAAKKVEEDSKAWDPAKDPAIEVWPLFRLSVTRQVSCLLKRWVARRGVHPAEVVVPQALF